jgi:DNA-binding NarL/FixJ family response regulator
MVIDRGLPDGDGLAFAKDIVSSNPRASVVLFTASEPYDVARETRATGIVYAHKIDGFGVLKAMMQIWARA